MKSLSAKELSQFISEGRELLLIDVRQPEELVYGTINGAHSFPVSEIPSRIDELENLIGSQDNNVSVIIFCRVGGRSEQVISVLEKRGSRELYNLAGGTQDYSLFDSSVQRY